MSSAAQCIFIRDRMLCSESLSRKCWVRSFGGHSEGDAIDAMVGSRREYRCKIVESGLSCWSNRLVIDGCRRVGSRSMLGRKPFLVYLIAEVMVMMKSGAARWLG